VITEFKVDTGCDANRYARVRVLDDPRDAGYLAGWLREREREVLALDSETNSRDPWDPLYRLRMVQLADVEEAWLLDAQAVGPIAIARAVSAHPRWIAHFAANDIRFVERGAPGAVRLDEDTPHFGDTQVVLAYYDPRTVMPEDAKDGIDPRLAHMKGLKETTERELSPVLAQTERELYAWFKDHAPVGQRVGDKMKSWGYANVPTDEPVYQRYSALDPLMTVRLWHKMAPVVRARGQWDIVVRDLAWQWDLDRATFRGMEVDEPYARWLDQAMTKVVADNAAELEARGVPASGQGPKINAAFQAMGLAPMKWTKPKRGKETGELKDPNPSWDKEVLKKLAPQETPAGDLARRLLASRSAGKFRKAYVEPMLTALEFDGKIHWQHRAIGTTTGRNSAYDPPLQQQPKKDTRVRAAYKAPDGHVWVSCDLSQGEPRTMAAMSQDANLRADILSGDLNGAIAAAAFGPAYDPSLGEVAGTPSYLMRNGSKAGFLAMCYGGGNDRVYATIGSEQADILGWKRRYHKLFEHGDQLNRMPAVRLESGRICPLWDRYYVDPATDEAKLRGKPSRKALNYKAQGTQRDLLLACWERLRARGYARYLAFVLHDEILLTVPVWMAEQARRDLEECMTFVWRGMEFACKAEIGGRTWFPQPADFDLRELDSIDA